ncbi:MAG: hypothetical protein TREMPRED_003148 [Tremellales sp. Tagirdzhanova-0007]|nr:MAG: hypothetical protein TREMPRED_003148 [Tremellales sp. Tagirdzhanova-0007]
MNARKAHNTGRNHVANVRDYFASLGHDTAQNIIDAIIQQHETGGRAQMLAAPSMRLGAGFMNPMAPPMNYPPFPATGGMGGGAGPYPPQSGAPPFRPPFPSSGSPLPPFPPSAPPSLNPMPNGMHSFPIPQQSPLSAANAPPPSFTPAAGPPQGGNPGIHPDRMRMMGR